MPRSTATQLALPALRAWPHARVTPEPGTYAACRSCGWSPWPESFGLVGCESYWSLARVVGAVRSWACGLCAWLRYVVGEPRPPGIGRAALAREAEFVARELQRLGIEAPVALWRAW